VPVPVHGRRDPGIRPDGRDRRSPTTEEGEVARKRPGDDAVGDRPDDEVYDDAAAEHDDDAAEDEPVGSGGTAVRERRPRARSDVRRTGVLGLIGRFFREIISELRKVIWPTRRELLTYTAVVIVFVTIITTIVALLDYGFAKLILFSFGS
jgi:preprotein translocase subunit SecE